jgi:hypothetical protein
MFFVSFGLSTDTHEWARFNCCHADAGVEDRRAGSVNDERIAIEFRDLREIFNHPTHAQESILQSCDVAGNAAAKAGQQRISLQFADHFRCVFV